MLKQPSNEFFKRSVKGNFAEFPRKHASESYFSINSVDMKIL